MGTGIPAMRSGPPPPIARIEASEIGEAIIENQPDSTLPPDGHAAQGDDENGGDAEERSLPSHCEISHQIPTASAVAVGVALRKPSPTQKSAALPCITKAPQHYPQTRAGDPTARSTRPSE